MESVAYVGMDVDKKKIAVALYKIMRIALGWSGLFETARMRPEKFFGEVTRGSAGFGLLRSGARFASSLRGCEARPQKGKTTTTTFSPSP